MDGYSMAAIIMMLLAFMFLFGYLVGYESGVNDGREELLADASYNSTCASEALETCRG